MPIVEKGIDKILRWVLTPLSWIYGAVMWVRNKLFDWGVLPQVEFDVPVVGIGNLTVGGTGKTPHTEYILSRLCGQYKIAVLSRGYKRKTKGFIIANSKSSPETIGDEPWQIYNKFGRLVKVAVCENRRKGISELLKLYPDLEMILLDDSFQHRWVKPRINIMLMEYGRPVYNDKLLPLGRLRESSHEINRADKVIITKCPENISPIDLRLAVKNMDLMKFQKIYFSRYSYGELSPVFPDETNYKAHLSVLTKNDSVFLLTGIAHPRYFVRHFRAYPFRKKVEHFSDHHDFSRSDIARIEQKFRAMKGERKLIITTEKDAVRLVFNPYFPQELKPFVFYQPISVERISGPQGHDNDLISDLKSELKLNSGFEVEGPDENDYYSPTQIIGMPSQSELLNADENPEDSREYQTGFSDSQDSLTSQEYHFRNPRMMEDSHDDSEKEEIEEDIE